MSQIQASTWNSLLDNDHPFLKYEFFLALERSASIGEGSGWIPLYFLSTSNLSFCFLKFHSYGEYIFDWQWAQAYEKHGVNYYPKMTSMVPFSPVTVPHFLNQKSRVQLIDAMREHYQKIAINSWHALYLTANETQFFHEHKIRESFQYHFTNKFTSFDSYLNTLKRSKRKSIRKERASVSSIKIKRITGELLTAEHASRMHNYYISTIEDKMSYAYLQPSFFHLLFSSMNKHILFIEAYENESPIAGAFFLYSKTHLYGRNWGQTKHIPFLHFELCLYQGIEFCIDKGIKTFEAGAQGEHKIPRGFLPVKTLSAHHFKNSSFNEAIARYINEESNQNQKVRDYLMERSPFKPDQES